MDQQIPKGDAFNRYCVECISTRSVRNAVVPALFLETSRKSVDLHINAKNAGILNEKNIVPKNLFARKKLLRKLPGDFLTEIDTGNWRGTGEIKIRRDIRRMDRYGIQQTEIKFSTEVENVHEQNVVGRWKRSKLLGIFKKVTANFAVYRWFQKVVQGYLFMLTTIMNLGQHALFFVAHVINNLGCSNLGNTLECSRLYVQNSKVMLNDLGGLNVRPA